MSKWVLRLLVLVVGLGVLLNVPEPWSYGGLALFVAVALGVLGVGRRPVKEWATVDPQMVTVVRGGPKSIDVVKVLREYLEPDPGAAVLLARLAGTPSEVGQVPSAAAAAELSRRLESLQTRVTIRPVT